MGKHESLIGQRFGRLTVIDVAYTKPKIVKGKSHGTVFYYNCKCDCGKTTVARHDCLLRGAKTSCGCERLERVEQKKLRMIGKKFNKLTVLEYVGMNKNGDATYLCQCDCGNKIITSGTSLRRGTTKSCGCLQKLAVKQLNFKDLTGQRFGKLTVIEQAENKVTSGGNSQVQWRCKCDCGGEIIVTSINLASGNTQSCGCKRYDTPHPNFIDLTGQKYGRLTVIKRVNNNKHRSAMWYCKCDCGGEIIINIHGLLHNKVPSCGCYMAERYKAHGDKLLKDLTGQKFGKLTAIERVGRNKYHKSLWKCKCDCGNVVTVGSTELINGSTKSCGCINSHGELAVSTLLRENNISFKQQKKYKDLKDISHLKFDFYIIDNDYLIEFDGIQHFQCTRSGWNTKEHFEATQRRDKMKNDYCIKNNIPLIRIPYTHLNDLCLEDLLLETSNFILNKEAIKNRQEKLNCNIDN